MIQLHSDYLMLQLTSGECIPCSAEEVVVELIGEAAALLPEELVHNAAWAVLHYFRGEQGRQAVSVWEFAHALARVLRGFGVDVKEVEPEPVAAAGAGSDGAIQAPPAPPIPAAAELDLRVLASSAELGLELAFFARLRQEVQEQLRASPARLHLTGLRDCVKQLAGTRRWSTRCQRLSDQIVDYLRQCVTHQPGRITCAIQVR